jgi:hypothetical protein
MIEHERQPPAWLEQALRDPGSVFADPEAVVTCAALSREERIRVLRAWEYDAAEIEVAEEEGMQGPENDLLRRIVLALARLTDGHDAESVGPTKQHGFVPPAE